MLCDESIYCKQDPFNYHILSEPLLLPCNSSICKKCVQAYLNQNKKLITCSYCSQDHYIKSCEQLKPNMRFLEHLKGNLKGISLDVLDRMRSYKGFIEETFNTRNECLKNCIDYHKEAVFIRIESIKIELDKLCEGFHSSLDNIHEVLKIELDSLDKQYCDMLTKNEKLVEAMTIQVKSLRQNEVNLLQNLYKCEESLNEMQEFNKVISGKLQKISLEVNDKWKPDSSVVGTLQQLISDPNERVKLMMPRKISLDPIEIQLASGMCSISDERLLLVDTDANEVLVLDKKFELLDRVKQVEGETFNYPLNICTDNRENVYLVDYNNNRVVIMDQNLRVVKKTLTSSFDYIGSPIDICFYGDCLFILDNQSSNIKQFLRDGVQVRDINLHDDTNKPLPSPLRITLDENTIAVLDSWNRICVYDFDGNYRDSIVSNESEITTVHFHNKNLYSIDKQAKLSCFTLKNDRIETLYERHLPFNNTSDYMVFFDNKLIIAYCYSNFLAVFDLN